MMPPPPNIHDINTINPELLPLWDMRGTWNPTYIFEKFDLTVSPGNTKIIENLFAKNGITFLGHLLNLSETELKKLFWSERKNRLMYGVDTIQSVLRILNCELRDEQQPARRIPYAFKSPTGGEIKSPWGRTTIHNLGEGDQFAKWGKSLLDEWVSVAAAYNIARADLEKANPPYPDIALTAYDEAVRFAEKLNRALASLNPAPRPG